MNTQLATTWTGPVAGNIRNHSRRTITTVPASVAGLSALQVTVVEFAWSVADGRGFDAQAVWLLREEPILRLH